MELLLIRHGRPFRLEVEQGPADPPLDPTGLAQAEAVARWVAHEGCDALYTSPLQRACQTAEPIERATQLEATVNDDIAEWDRDANAYIPTEDLPEVAPEIWSALAGNDWSALGIDLPGFLHRVARGIDAIVAAHPGQRVAVVCHGGVINAVTASVLNLSRVLYFQPDYTSISRVAISRSGTRSILSLNETGHLRTITEQRGA